MTEMKVSKGAATTAEDIKARIQARVKSAVDQAMTRVGLEIAVPEEWWNLWAVGPVKEIAPGGPLLPHKVIKIGEKAYVYTVIWFNPATLPNGINACSFVTNLGCELVVRYCTGNVCTWTRGPNDFNAEHNLTLVPDQCWYVDVLEFTAETEGLYEMHICARVTGCHDDSAPPLAGFATAVADIDADIFYPRQLTPELPEEIPPHTMPWPGFPSGTYSRWEYDIPIRFLIYS